MKLFLMVSGGLFCLICLFVLGIFLYGNLTGPSLDKESKLWVDKVVPEILSTWSPEILIQNSSSEFLNVVSKETIKNSLIESSEVLGSLKEYKGSRGESGIHIGGQGKVITAEYVVEIDFEKGSATIFIQSVKENGEWKIRNFALSPQDSP